MYACRTAVHSCVWFVQRVRSFTAIGALVCIAACSVPAWSQSAWPSYPNNSAISVTSGGNVGIGTTSPAASLDVFGSSGITTANGKGVSNVYVGADYPTIGFNAYGPYTAGQNGYGGLFQFQNSTGDLIYYNGSNVSAGSNHSHTVAFAIRQNFGTHEK